MARRTPLLSLAVALALSACSPGAIADRVQTRVERDIDRRVEQRAMDIANRTLDLAEDAIVCVVTDEECIADARAQGQEPVVVNTDGEPVSGYEPAGNGSGSAGSGSSTGGASGPQGVWANYDFVPGERVLFVHDFEGTRVGNFPSRLDYISGELDVVRLGSGDDATNALRVGEGTSEAPPGGNGCFSIPLPEALPEQFTLEFRVMHSDPGHRVGLEVFSDGSDDSPDGRCTYPPFPRIFLASNEVGLALDAGRKSTEAGALPTNVWSTVAVGCDGDYCKMFVDGERVANVPRFEFPRDPMLHVFMRVYRYSLYIDDIRIAEGGQRSLYDDLEANGEISTTAIRFDSGSDRIKPESGGYLDQVVEMMQQHPDLRLEIQGHTDSDGSDATNQSLSDRRAVAVRAYLEDRGIAGTRLTTVGYGESQPVADNGTAEGKAQNRRVVFKRL